MLSECVHESRVHKRDLRMQHIDIPEENRVLGNREGLDQVSEVDFLHDVNVDEELPKAVLGDILNLLGLVP
jgi:hypothetical protein